MSERFDEIVDLGARALCRASGFFPDGFREASIYSVGTREAWQMEARRVARAVLEPALSALKARDAMLSEMSCALRAIESGSFPGASTLAVAGDWKGMCGALQTIARDTLNDNPITKAS